MLSIVGYSTNLLLVLKIVLVVFQCLNLYPVSGLAIKVTLSLTENTFLFQTLPKLSLTVPLPSIDIVIVLN
jgi:hypothetical protein